MSQWPFLHGGWQMLGQIAPRLPFPNLTQSTPAPGTAPVQPPEESSHPHLHISTISQMSARIAVLETELSFERERSLTAQKNCNFLLEQIRESRTCLCLPSRESCQSHSTGGLVLMDETRQPNRISAPPPGAPTQPCRAPGPKQYKVEVDALSKGGVDVTNLYPEQSDKCPATTRGERSLRPVPPAPNWRGKTKDNKDNKDNEDNEDNKDEKCASLCAADKTSPTALESASCVPDLDRKRSNTRGEFATSNAPEDLNLSKNSYDGHQADEQGSRIHRGDLGSGLKLEVEDLIDLVSEGLDDSKDLNLKDIKDLKDLETLDELKDLESTQNVSLYRPHPEDNNIYRTVLVRGIPPTANRKAVTSRICGGSLLSIQLLDMESIHGSPAKIAIVVFAREDSARAFVEYTRRTGKNYACGAVNDGMSFELLKIPTFATSKAINCCLAQEVTRCLAITTPYFPPNMPLRKVKIALESGDFHQSAHAGTIISINRDDDNVIHLELSSIAATLRVLKFAKRIRGRGGCGVEVRVLRQPDPCNVPIPCKVVAVSPSVEVEPGEELGPEVAASNNRKPFSTPD